MLLFLLSYCPYYQTHRIPNLLDLKSLIPVLTFQQSLGALLGKSDQDKLEESDSQTQMIRRWEKDGVVYIFMGNSNGTLTLDAMKKESWGFERAGSSRSKKVIFTTGRNFIVSLTHLFPLISF